MDNIPHDTKEGRCLYCSIELDVVKWTSSWGDHDVQHYKSMRCGGCGKKNWCKVDFSGSGHDSAMRNEDSELESVLRKEREDKY